MKLQHTDEPCLKCKSEKRRFKAILHVYGPGFNGKRYWGWSDDGPPAQEKPWMFVAENDVDSPRTGPQVLEFDVAFGRGSSSFPRLGLSIHHAYTKNGIKLEWEERA